MEESENENDNESQKLLYKYQYAFLHMQKSFTSMFKIVRSFEQQRRFKYLQIWKRKTLANPQGLRLQMAVFKSKLRILETRFRNNFRIFLLGKFQKIVKTAKLKNFCRELKVEFQKTKENNGKELQMMEKEVSKLRKSQNELENITKNYKKKELGVKAKVEGKNNAESISNENKELEQQIDEIDKKTFSLFKELNLILDELEEMKKKKVKKIKKKAKVVIKGRNALPISV